MNKKLVAGVALVALLGLVLFVSYDAETLNLVKKHKSLKQHKGDNGSYGYNQNSPCQTTCTGAKQVWCGPSKVLRRWFCCASGQTCQQKSQTYGWGWLTKTVDWSECSAIDKGFKCSD